MERSHNSDLELSLGGELRNLRQAAGITARLVAKKTAMSPSKLSRIEHGEVSVSERDVARIVDVLGVNPTTRERLILKSRQHGSRNRPAELDAVSLVNQDQIFIIEQAAFTHFRYQGVVIPGPLQTPQYARKVLRMSQPAVADDEVEPAVATRLQRQSLLFDRRRTFLCVITEDTLRPTVITGALMTDQLFALLKYTEEPNIDIRIIPMNRQVSVFATMGFQIVDKSVVVDANIRSTVSETAQSLTLRLQGAANLAFYSSVMASVVEIALDSQESIAFIKQKYDECNAIDLRSSFKSRA